MKVQNIGGKIVSIGDVVILPGESKPVPDSYADNAALACLVKHKNISLIREEQTKPANGQDRPVDAPPAEKPPVKEGDGEVEKKPLSRMNKSELVKECRRLGIEVGPDDSNPILVDKIKAAIAE